MKDVILHIELRLDAASALTMAHVAEHPVLVQSLGDKGAAVAAYLCRELAANALEHGHARGEGGLELSGDRRVAITLPGPSFDSSRPSAHARGGLASCKKLLDAGRVEWRHERGDASNSTILTFTQRLDYEVSQ